MAFHTLVSLENTIDQVLIHSKYSISRREKQQIISLDKYVVSFRAFIEDFPENAKNLEARIRDAAMEAEDIIDWFMVEQIRHYFFTYVHWLVDLRRIKFEFQLHKVIDKMDSIAKEVVELKNSIMMINEMDSSTQVAVAADAAAAGKMKMVGLNEDLLEIMDRLCGDSRQLQILPITGMGGIGKTTLARNAYDDPLIMEHFDIRVWITISQDYSEGRILSELLDSMKKFLVPESEKKPEAEDSQLGSQSMAENSGKGNKSVIENPEESNREKAVKVYRALYGRRFLIVMDDLWSIKVLDDAKKLFPNNNNGSRILLTTRLGDVAGSSAPSHEMRLMDADQSWGLLQEKVLEHHDRIPNEVATIGKEIASSCGGLPLAVVVVAGVLSTVSMTQTSWGEIAKNIKSTLATTGDGRIGKILSLSYNHLPHHLRPCLLYMAGFPEDHQIKLMDLMRLWIAEGFVKSVASKSSEDSAQEYMGDLVKRNLVVVVSLSKSLGEIKSCSLHDLVRDLCIQLAEEEKFLVHLKGGRAPPELMKNVPRISISHSNLDSFTNIISWKIRTIMYFEDTHGSFGSFRLLRVLDVLRVRLTPSSLPYQFFELYHLRYLAFWYDHVDLPKAISNLQSLQTLVIAGFDPIYVYHEKLVLPQLRHLIFLGSCYYLTIYEAPPFSLQHLQTLGKLQNFECSVTNLNMFPNLKKLSLTYNSVGGIYMLFHNLVLLRQLEKLKLERSHIDFGPDDTDLVLPHSLKKLALIGWGYRKPYLNIVGPLPNLQVLKLREYFFRNQEWTTSEEDFPKLRFLLFKKCNLKQWNTEASHFPVLEHLVFHSCWSLAQIPNDIGDISTLKLIEVEQCEKSLADSAQLTRR